MRCKEGGEFCKNNNWSYQARVKAAGGLLLLGTLLHRPQLVESRGLGHLLRDEAVTKQEGAVVRVDLGRVPGKKKNIGTFKYGKYKYGNISECMVVYIHVK
jgi:hypothetical protein